MAAPAGRLKRFYSTSSPTLPNEAMAASLVIPRIWFENDRLPSQLQLPDEGDRNAFTTSDGLRRLMTEGTPEMQNRFWTHLQKVYDHVTAAQSHHDVAAQPRPSVDGLNITPRVSVTPPTSEASPSDSFFQPTGRYNPRTAAKFSDIRKFNAETTSREQLHEDYERWERAVIARVNNGSTEEFPYPRFVALWLIDQLDGRAREYAESLEPCPSPDHILFALRKYFGDHKPQERAERVFNCLKQQEDELIGPFIAKFYCLAIRAGYKDVSKLAPRLSAKLNTEYEALLRDKKDWAGLSYDDLCRLLLKLEAGRGVDQ